MRAVRRRNWSTDDRLRMMRETLDTGAIAHAVADRHGASNGLLYTWRKQILAPATAGLALVAVVRKRQRTAGQPRDGAALGREHQGDGGAADAATLPMVLAEMGGR